MHNSFMRHTLNFIKLKPILDDIWRQENGFPFLTSASVSVQLLFCLYNLIYCTLQSDLSASWTLLKDIIIALSPNSFPLSEIGGPQNTVSANLNYRRTGMIQSGTVIAEDVDRVRISQLMEWTANPQTVNCISLRKEFITKSSSKVIGILSRN